MFNDYIKQYNDNKLMMIWCFNKNELDSIECLQFSRSILECYLYLLKYMIQN